MNKRPSTDRPSFALALALVFAACGTSGSKSPAGTGGSTGTGGATGTGGSTATGGATGTGGNAATVINCFNTPACKVDLYTATGCQPAGTCIVQFPTTGGAAVCYSNGVKFLTTLDSTSGQPTYSLVNSNGTTCFAAAVTVDDVSGNSTLTFTNAAGTVAAIETQPGMGPETVACGGVTTTITPNPGGCTIPNGTWTGSNCVEGTCP